MKRLTLFLFLVFAAPAAWAQPDQSFQTFLQNLGQEAVLSGVSTASVQSALASITLDETVIELDTKQPEHKTTFARYLKNTITQPRIDKGRRLMDDYAAALSILETHYGIPPGIVVALWAVESSYGVNKGDFSVLSSLATLAYEGRRADFFRRELIEAMKIMDEEGMTPDQLLGSWAGAMGQSQFMPSTFRRYAMDGDGDRHRDIWDNELDVLASIANYLAAEGWQPGQGWGAEVRLTRSIPESQKGLEKSKDIAQWQRMGLRPLHANALPHGAFSASLIEPDGPGGRSFLVYDNFRALMRWNRSTYFATSVGLLADLLSNGT